jgi:Ca-activated chloride channel family protein
VTLKKKESLKNDFSFFFSITATSLHIMPEFENIEFLAGLIILVPLVLLFVYVLQWKQKVKRRLGDPRLVDHLIQNYSSRLYRLKIIIVLAAVALGIIALANLRKPLKTRGSKANGIDVMVALDVSKSMLSQDEKPSRLDKAKQFINQLTDKLGSNRVGLILFAGQAYLQMPLTADATATRMFVANASPDLVPLQGTDLSAALQLSDGSLDTQEKKYKAVVLITDGEDHDDKALETVKQLADHGTILYTVGVGSPEGAPITEPGTNEYKRDDNGQTIISKLNVTLLQQLAQATKGTYYHLDNTSAVSDAVVGELNGMEKKTINNAGGYVEYRLFYPFFLALAVVLLIVEVFIPERKLQVS